MGAPIIAVKIPMGNSDGSTTLLLTVSAVNSKTLPKIADSGKIKL